MPTELRARNLSMKASQAESTSLSTPWSTPTPAKKEVSYEVEARLIPSPGDQ